MSYLKIVPEGYVNSDASTGLIHGYIYPKAVCIGGMSVDPSRAAVQMEMVRTCWHQNVGRRLRHFILCFDHTEAAHFASLNYVAYLAYEICEFYKDEYQIVFGIHTAPELHIHFVMNMIRYTDGRRFPARFSDDIKLAEHIREVVCMPVNITYN